MAHQLQLFSPMWRYANWVMFGFLTLVQAVFGFEWLMFSLVAFIAYRINELSYRTYRLERHLEKDIDADS